MIEEEGQKEGRCRGRTYKGLLIYVFAGQIVMEKMYQSYAVSMILNMSIKRRVVAD